MPKLSLAAVAVIGAFASTEDVLAQQVTSVTLYPGSATVERSAKIGAGGGRLEMAGPPATFQCPPVGRPEKSGAGGGRLEMAGLPANFDVRTLRVEADAGIAIGEIAVHDVA